MEREITGIKAQKKNPDRVSIYLDGEYGFGLSRIVAAWLQIGQRLDDKKIESLLASDASEVAYNKALRLINLKPRTEKELRLKLISGGFTGGQCDSVLQRLREAGLVADDRYARQWVENRNEMHPRSRRLISLELRQKGVADEVIEQVLEDSSADEDLALKAATQYARKLTITDGMKFRARLSAFLARRGFSYGTIAPIVRSVWEAVQSENTHPEH
ncbi:regulatory protein RecX [bacterium]|nr:regulatory protein RecX [bacterium]